MDNATFLSLSGRDAIDGMVSEALPTEPLVTLLRDWTKITVNPAIPSITYTSQALSTSSLVGQYVGSMSFPYLKRNLNQILPTALVYLDPYPTTFVRLQQYFADRYGIWLDDGEFALQGTSTPLSGTSAIGAVPNEDTGWVTLKALPASIRFVNGSTLSFLPVHASVPAPLPRLLTFTSDLRIAALTDHLT